MKLKDLIKTEIQKDDIRELGDRELFHLEAFIKTDLQHVFGIEISDSTFDQFTTLIYRSMLWLEYKHQQQLSLLESGFFSCGSMRPIYLR